MSGEPHKYNRFVRTSVALVWMCTAVGTSAEDWPGWRGSRGDGSTKETSVPVHWDEERGENIAWKTPIPGVGHSSPIIWKDTVFLASCLEESKERILLCLDRISGKIRWQKTVITAPLESKHSLNSHASSTPATDGKLIYVSFLEVDGRTVPAPNVGRQRPVTPGKLVTAAYDFDGNQKWISRVGDFVSAHGFCTNPVLFENLVIVNGDHDGESYVAALDKTTGKTVWKTPRRYKIRSYVTPLLRWINGEPHLVFSGSKCVVSLNPRDGSRNWTVEGPTEQFVASMVFDGQHFYLAAGFPTYHVMAIRPDGRGDVTNTHVAWHVKNARCYVPSPVVVNGYLFVADDRGTANCFDTQTGNRLWQNRLSSHFSTSLVTAGGNVYFLADDGTTKIVKASDKFELVATNKLQEECFASPVIAHGHYYVRSENSLYSIGPKE